MPHRRYSRPSRSGDRRRAHHHRRRRVSGRPAAAAGRAHRRSRRARVVYASPTRLVVDRAAGISTAGRSPVRVDGVAGRDGGRRGRARRSRPACIRSTTRSSIATATCTSPTAARAASRCRSRSSACARTARARRSRRASSTRRRWRSIRRAGCTCRAASRARSTASTPDGAAEPFATDLGVACGLAFAPDGTLFVGDRSGTIFRVDRDGQRDDVRVAAGERRGVSPGARARRRAVRHAPTLSSYDVAVSHRRRTAR